MARYRLSDPAKADIAALLRTSETMHGAEARIRYRALLTAALRRIAVDPLGLLTVDRAELFAGVRSYHIRHSRKDSGEAPVGDPVHVIYYRTIDRGIVEIVRVLHDRMEPGRDVGPKPRGNARSKHAVESRSTVKVTSPAQTSISAVDAAR